MLRAILKATLCLAAFLAGCGAHNEKFPITLAYGSPPPKHDPTVEIADLSYSPSPMHLGDTLVYTATLNKPAQAGEVHVIVEIGNESKPLVGYISPTMTIRLSDIGPYGDVESGDGIWTGRHFWIANRGVQHEVPVTAHLRWADGYRTDPIAFAPLTVLPAEDDAP